MKEQILAGGRYLTLGIFMADMRRMCQNARVYNAADTVYYKMADKVEAIFEDYLNQHLVFDATPLKA